MWQQVIAAFLVIVAAVYVARTLGPKSWRRKARTIGAKRLAQGPCGCSKDDKGCG